MLRIANDLSRASLAAGEPFLNEVQLLLANGGATDINDQSLVLTLYNPINRETVERIEYQRVVDERGFELFRIARAGTFSEALYGRTGLLFELARRYNGGREVLGRGELTVMAASAPLPSLDAVGIGDTACRITIKEPLLRGDPPAITVQYVAYENTVPTTPPSFLTPAGIQSDGTPQVGEQLIGADGVVAGGTIVSRRWLLGSTVLATVNAYTPASAGQLTFESRAEGPGGATTSSAQVTVTAGVEYPANSFGGTGLEEMGYSSLSPFVDIMRNCGVGPQAANNGFGVWTGGNSGGEATLVGATYDARGWPLTLPSGTTGFKTFVPCRGTRTFVVLHSGTGQLDYNPGNGAGATVSNIVRGPGRDVVTVNGGTGDAANWWQISTLQFSASSPKRWAVAELAHEALLADQVANGANANNRWRPDFIADCKLYGYLRYMDWCQVNYSTLVNWTDRRKVDFISYASDVAGTKINQVPFELMLELANLTDTDAWVCSGPLMTDACITSLFTLFRDSLKPTLAYRNENANEIWNTQFKAATVYTDKWYNLVPPNTGFNIIGYSLGYETGRRAKIADDLWRAVGKRSMLINVLASQTGFVAMQQGFAGGFVHAGSAGMPATDYTTVNEGADRFSTALYWAAGFSAASTTSGGKTRILQMVNQFEANNPQGLTDFFTEMQDGSILASFIADNPPDHIGAAVARTITDIQYATSLGLPWDAYESNTHVGNYGQATWTQSERDRFRALYTAAFADPRMETQATGVWRSVFEAGARSVCYFCSLSLNPDFALRNSLTEEPPKWRAAQKFLRATTLPITRPVPAFTATANNPVAVVAGSAPLIFSASGGVPPYKVERASGIAPAGRALSRLRETGTFTAAGVVPGVFRVSDVEGREVLLTRNRTVLATLPGKRYFRLTARRSWATANGFAALRASELRFLTAEGATVDMTAWTASGPFNDGLPPGNLIDGNLGTVWGSQSVGPDYLIFDAGADRAMPAEVRVYGSGSDNVLNWWDLDWGDDSTTWMKIAGYKSSDPNFIPTTGAYTSAMVSYS